MIATPVIQQRVLRLVQTAAHAALNIIHQRTQVYQQSLAMREQRVCEASEVKRTTPATYREQLNFLCIDRMDRE